MKRAVILGTLIGMYILTVSGFAFSAQGITAPDRGENIRIVTFEEAISMALEGNPELRAMRSSREAKVREVGSARSNLLPHVRIEERFMRTNNPMYAFGSKLNQARITASDFNPDLLNEPEDIDDYQTSITVEQALFAPEAYVGLRMAKKEAEASGKDLARKREEVVLNVVKAYMNVITAGNYLEVAEKGLLDASEHHRIAEARYKAGLGLYSDTLRTDVSVRQAEERKLRAEKGLKLAGRALSLLMGLDGQVGVAAIEPDYDVPGLEASLEAALGRSDVRAMELRVENAGNNVKLTGAKYLPLLGVGGSWQLNSEDTAFGSDGESYSVMAFLRWDLYDGGLRRSQRQKARAKHKESREYLEGLRKQVTFKVHEAYMELEEARSGLELAEARLRLAEESQRLISSRYENSLTTVVELMDAQSALNAARAAVVEKNNNYRVAAAELRYESGMIMKAFEKEPGGTD